MRHAPRPGLREGITFGGVKVGIIMCYHVTFTTPIQCLETIFGMYVLNNFLLKRPINIYFSGGECDDICITFLFIVKMDKAQITGSCMCRPVSTLHLNLSI